MLEIKCPWTYRALTVTEYGTKKDACLEIIDNNIKLKRTHIYYFQVQCQTHATNRKWCDFFLCTTKDSFLERIIFDENIFAVSVAKAKVVYEKLVLPEIFSRDLQMTLRVEKEVKKILHDIVNKVTDICINEDVKLSVFDMIEKVSLLG